MNQSDYPQMMLQNAAKQFIADLENAGHSEAAGFLRNKYVPKQMASEQARYVHGAPNKEQLIHG